jgi:hypothetical protein
MGGVPQQPMGRPETEQVRPLAAPPYLASQTAARMHAPVEPWDSTLRMVMIIYGVALIAAFAAPWGVGGGKTLFAFTGLGDMPAVVKVSLILIPGTGILAVLFGALPLPAIGRGIAAALLGAIPVLYGLIAPAIAGGKLDAMSLIEVMGTLVLVGGLIVRSQYKGSMAARIMATVGALAVLAVFVIPQAKYGDKMGIQVMFDMLSDAPGKAKVRPIMDLLPFALALFSLLVWIPGPSGAGSIIIAWLWIVLPLLTAVVGLLVGGEIGATLKAGLGHIIWVPTAAMAWIALLGYGSATVVGKQLEHA